MGIHRHYCLFREMVPQKHKTQRHKKRKGAYRGDLWVVHVCNQTVQASILNEKQSSLSFPLVILVKAGNAGIQLFSGRFFILLRMAKDDEDGDLPMNDELLTAQLNEIVRTKRFIKLIKVSGKYYY